MSKNLFHKLVNHANQKNNPLPLDGEILYSKNNVCIHPPSLLANSVLHHTGFMTLSATFKDEVLSLLLTWNPATSNFSIANDVNIELAKEYDDLEVGDCLSKQEIPEIQVNENAFLPIDTTSSGLGVPTWEKSDNRLSVGINSLETSRSPQAVYNFQFPENSITYKKQQSPSYQGHVIRSPKDQAYGAFSIDLAYMRSLRIFFRNKDCTCGELIIASKESQYRVLHFHNGGLDFVCNVLRNWKESIKQNKSAIEDLSINHFSVISPYLTKSECHPEEELYQRLTTDMWALSVDEFGRIGNKEIMYKNLFFRGVDKELRPEVWPYLLKYFHFDSTAIERNELRIQRSRLYHEINLQREQIFSDKENTEEFYRNVSCSVTKDVIRTDRTNPFYQGDNNVNLNTLQRILLNYSVYTKTGYTQGMSDLLSPLLIEIKEESDTFWCFVGLMHKTVFISSPSDTDMVKQLFFLRELLRVLVPNFYNHLLKCGPGAFELLFAHRWILLCFKREFNEGEALAIWEACWTQYQSNYFHLFVCAAIIALYGSDVADTNLAIDEMLLHFSLLSLQMNGELVLRKARGLLHTLKIKQSIPCTLQDLLCRSNAGRITCVGGKDCLNGCGKSFQINSDDNKKKFSIAKVFQNSFL